MYMYLGEGSVVKKRIFRFFARFSGPKISIWLLIEPLKKKVRGRRPDLVNAHESYNHRPSYLLFWDGSLRIWISVLGHYE